MIIQCPHCSARFRLDERKLSGRRQLLKCSRCRRVFPAAGPSLEPKSPALGRPSPPPPPEQESLSFSFDDDEDWSAGATVTTDVLDEPFLLDPQEAPTERDRRAEEVDPPPPPAQPERADDLTFADPADEEEEEDEMSGGSISLKPVFLFLLVVVGAYGLFARALYADPDWARRILERVPLMGEGLQGRTLNRKVVLRGVEARYEATKEGASVLLVTGHAHNQSTTAINSIQVVTKLFDGEERLIGEQLAFCGNAVRSELVRDLTIRQIAILKGLKPPQRFSIRPDEECSFVTFFTDLPAAPATFTSEVAATQAHA